MTVAGARVLGSRYELGPLVGSGGMADVYRATDLLLTRTVAVKVLRASSSDEGERDRFRSEARTLASLNHRGLVTLLDAGILDEHPYLVLELVEGPSLSRAIRDDGPIAPTRVAAIGVQVADALAYAHRCGVVHRDVKPGNILLAADGRTLLADFGIARLLADDARHTRTGDTIGSPAYLAPEQVNGGPLTEAVDVYSLGLVLLEALTGARAFPGAPVEAALLRLTANPSLPPSLDDGWRELLERMTAREAGERPTASEVAAALGALDGSDRTVVGLPLPVAGRATRRRVAVAGIGALLLAVLLAVGVAVLTGPDPASRPGPRQAPAVAPDPVREPSPTARPTAGTTPVALTRAPAKNTAPAKRPARGPGKKHGHK